jgi:hypothetical protein
MHKNNQTNKLPSNCTNRRKLFIATDLPLLKEAVDEVKSKWGDKYEIYHGTFHTQGLIYF